MSDLKPDTKGMTMSDYLKLGSISRGTLRPQDLASAILDAAAGFPLDVNLREDLAAIAADEGRDEEWDSEVINDGIDALEEWAPPYCFVGFHEGDGSDLGVWPAIESLEDDARYGDEVIKVDDLAGIDGRVPRFAMLVNDHGNVTLYRLKLVAEPIWDCV
jgi:hypothetical protein